MAYSLPSACQKICILLRFLRVSNVFSTFTDNKVLILQTVLTFFETPCIVQHRRIKHEHVEPCGRVAAPWSHVRCVPGPEREQAGRRSCTSDHIVVTARSGSAVRRCSRCIATSAFLRRVAWRRCASCHGIPVHPAPTTASLVVPEQRNLSLCTLTAARVAEVNLSFPGYATHSAPMISAISVGTYLALPTPFILSTIQYLHLPRRV